MNDSEFGLEDWEKMFVRQWAAGHQIMGRIVRTPFLDVEDQEEYEPNPYDGTYSEE
jgi:hypothetical protein